MNITIRELKLSLNHAARHASTEQAKFIVSHANLQFILSDVRQWYKDNPDKSDYPLNWVVNDLLEYVDEWDRYNVYYEYHQLPKIKSGPKNPSSWLNDTCYENKSYQYVSILPGQTPEEALGRPLKNRDDVEDGYYFDKVYDDEIIPVCKNGLGGRADTFKPGPKMQRRMEEAQERQEREMIEKMKKTGKKGWKPEIV